MNLPCRLILEKFATTAGGFYWRVLFTAILLQTPAHAQTPAVQNSSIDATASSGIRPFAQTVEAIKSALPQAEFGIPETKIVPHPERLFNRTKITINVATRNAVKGPFANYRDFKSRGISYVSTPLVAFNVRNFGDVLVEMPEEYFSELNKALKDDSGSSEMQKRLRLSELPTLIDELPNPLYIKWYFLSCKANPEDDWSTQTYSSAGFVSATAMYNGGFFSLFKMKVSDPFLRADFMHEWSHELRHRFEDDEIIRDFDSAVRIESDWSPNQYANRSANECFAVFGERLLSTHGTEFLEACERAPIRTTFWMKTLQRSMQNLTPQNRSVNNAQYEKRIGHVLSETRLSALAKVKTQRAAETNESKQVLLDQLAAALSRMN